jgi:uncharacterized YigZ family protein
MTEKAVLVQVDIPDKKYLTIGRSCWSLTEHEEKRSRFICHLFYVETERDVKEKIAKANNRFADASHNCYAYILFNDNIPLKRFSDDHEPSGTAGMPILKVLESNDIYNILAIVTRYFGGTLLGTGGLARAYSKAAAGAVEKAERAYLVKMSRIYIDVAYNEFGAVKNMLLNSQAHIIDIDYTQTVGIRLKVIHEMAQDTAQKIMDLTGGTARIQIMDPCLERIKA